MGDSTDTGTDTRGGWALIAARVRPERAVLIVAIVLGLVSTAVELISPLVTREVLHRLETGTSVLGIAALLLVVLVGANVIGYVQTVMLGAMAERIVRVARRSMLGTLVRARVDATRGRTAGEMVSRVTSDTTLIREAATSSLVNLVNGSIALFGSLALMAYLDAPLLLVTVLVVAAGGGATLLLMPRLSRLQQEVQDRLGTLGARLDGTVRAIRTVKASRAEDRELAVLHGHVDDASRLGYRAIRVEAAAMTMSGFAVNLVIIVVLGVGAHRVALGALDVPSLVAFLLYVFGLMWPISMITMSVTTLQSGLAAARRIDEVTSLPLESDPAGASTAPTNVDTAAQGDTPVLTFDDVTVRYGPGLDPALDGVSLTVPRRGHIALVGPSGAGKTTVLSAMLRFVNIDGGRMILDGADYEDWTIDAVRSRIGYVEQDAPLAPGTVRENLGHARPEATDPEMWHALAQLGLTAKVQSLPNGLDTEILGTTLSGGERQRIAVARALIAQPEVLLLDEATAQLDARTEAALSTAVRELATRGAVISVAHRLSTVMDADQIIVLEGGHVRASGTHGELLESDSLYGELVAALRITAGR